MGQAILRTLLERDDVRLLAALVRPGSTLAGTPLSRMFGAGAGDLHYTTTLPAAVAPDVLIDFSAADAFDDALALAVARKIAFVSGTTGLDARQRVALDQAAASIPVLWSANFSLGVALLSRLVAETARALPDWDCEISEAHHRAKKDAPSGTALALGRAVAGARGQDFDAVAQTSRATGQAARAPASIGFAVTRAGDIVGEHTVLFAAAGERIELTHRATDRMIFARGAAAAAAWIHGQPAGCHALVDVLGDGAQVHSG